MNNHINHQTELLITNGGLGTDNQKIVRYNISSPQGMAKVRYWTNYHAKRLNKPAWAEIFTYGDKARVIYKAGA